LSLLLLSTPTLNELFELNLLIIHNYLPNLKYLYLIVSQSLLSLAHKYAIPLQVAPLPSHQKNVVINIMKKFRSNINTINDNYFCINKKYFEHQKMSIYVDTVPAMSNFPIPIPNLTKAS